MGFFNWGIFLGYSMSFVLILAEKDYGWRSVYYIAGSPGILIAIIILVTIKEPKRATEGAMVSASAMTGAGQKQSAMTGAGQKQSAMTGAGQKQSAMTGAGQKQSAMTGAG